MRFEREGECWAAYDLPVGSRTEKLQTVLQNVRRDRLGDQDYAQGLVKAIEDRFRPLLKSAVFSGGLSAAMAENLAALNAGGFSTSLYIEDAFRCHWRVEVETKRAAGSPWAKPTLRRSEGGLWLEAAAPGLPGAGARGEPSIRVQLAASDVRACIDNLVQDVLSKMEARALPAQSRLLAHLFARAGVRLEVRNAKLEHLDWPAVSPGAFILTNCEVRDCLMFIQSDRVELDHCRVWGGTKLELYAEELFWRYGSCAHEVELKGSVTGGLIAPRRASGLFAKPTFSPMAEQLRYGGEFGYDGVQASDGKKLVRTFRRSIWEKDYLATTAFSAILNRSADHIVKKWKKMDQDPNGPV